MRLKRGGAYVDASPFIKCGGVYEGVSAFVKTQSGYVSAINEAPIAPPADYDEFLQWSSSVLGDDLPEFANWIAKTSNEDLP
jgi:hypothetical protein